MHDGQEVFFTSEEAVFDGELPIRGGVPIIFPQFSGRGDILSHGFARRCVWEVRSQDENHARLQLSPTDYTRFHWDHPFTAVFTIERGTSVSMTLEIINEGQHPFSFTAALHSYFRIGHIGRIVVKGLYGLSYRDSLDGDTIKEEQSRAVMIEEEVDRIYLGSSSQQIYDLSLGRTISLSSTGFCDAVVWNPWIEKSRRLADLGDEEYREMLCIEAAVIETPVVLDPRERWIGSQTIKVGAI